MENENWLYIALGDSFILGFGEIFASHIREDLGVGVVFEDHSVGGQQSSELLLTLQENHELRNKLYDADFITFMIPMALFKELSIAYVESLSKGIDYQDGMRKSFELYSRTLMGSLMSYLYCEILPMQLSASWIVIYHHSYSESGNGIMYSRK